VAVTEIYVNEQQITHLVTPYQFMNDTSVTKTVTFVEPSTPGALAIKGYDNDEVAAATLMLRCVSSNSGSLWNFVSSVAQGGWKTIAGIGKGQKTDTIPNDYYVNFPASNIWPVTSGNGLIGSSYTLTDACGTPDPTEKIRPKQKSPVNFFWSVRKYVPSPVCGSNSPTLATLPPTLQPSTATPTTVAPVTGGPTTLQPSELPTLSPSTYLPTFMPSTTPR
jgi:hypothetical protein